MSSPSSSTRPVIQAPSISSCIRFRVRRKVDLPHPDGPISACTRLGAKVSDTLLIATNFPYIAVSLSVTMREVASAAGLAGSAARLSVSSATESGAPMDGQAGTEAQHEHDENQHQRGGPGI